MAAIPWVVLEVAAFASRYSAADRGAEDVLPRPAPLSRPRRVARPRAAEAGRVDLAAAVVPAGLLVLLPLESLLSVAITSDTFAFVPFFVSRRCSTAERPTCGSCSAWGRPRSRSPSPACRDAWPSTQSRSGLPRSWRSAPIRCSGRPERNPSGHRLAGRGAEGRELGRRPRGDRCRRRLRQQHLARREPPHALADGVLEPEHQDDREPRRAAVVHHARSPGTIDQQTGRIVSSDPFVAGPVRAPPTRPLRIRSSLPERWSPSPVASSSSIASTARYAWPGRRGASIPTGGPAEILPCPSTRPRASGPAASSCGCCARRSCAPDSSALRGRARGRAPAVGDGGAVEIGGRA